MFVTLKKIFGRVRQRLCKMRSDEIDLHAPSWRVRLQMVFLFVILHLPPWKLVPYSLLCLLRLHHLIETAERKILEAEKHSQEKASSISLSLPPQLFKQLKKPASFVYNIQPGKWEPVEKEGSFIFQCIISTRSPGMVDSPETT